MISAAALLTIGLTAQVATAPEATNLQAEVERLVRQLDDQERAVREAAEKQLLACGPAVLALLPRIDDGTPAEVKQRLERVRLTLERAAAEQSAEPARLTFQGKFTFPQILTGIQEQTGNRVIDYRDRFGQSQAGLELELDIQDQPFWPALDLILDQAGLTIYTYVGQTRTLGLVARGDNERDRAGAGAYSGLFRVSATEIVAQRNLRNTDNQALRLRLEVLWEPRTAPILIRHALADLAIKGDDGSEIPVTAPEGTIEMPVQSAIAGIDLVLPLTLPDRTVKKIASCDGKFTALIPGRDETFEFTDLAAARNVVRQTGGLTVTLDRVRRNGSLYEFRIRVKFDDAGGAFQSHLDWASNNEVYLLSADGKRIDNPNFERYLEREQEVGFRYLFPLGDEEISEYRLVYKSPAAIINVPVEYSLRDIELP